MSVRMAETPEEISGIQLITSSHVAGRSSEGALSLTLGVEGHSLSLVPLRSRSLFRIRPLVGLIKSRTALETFQLRIRSPQFVAANEKDMCFRCEAKPQEFEVPQWSLGQIKAAVAPHLFIRSSSTGFYYLARDLSMSIFLMSWTYILDAKLQTVAGDLNLSYTLFLLRTPLWLFYWWFQGLVFTGMWVLGHECGHGAFSPSVWICDTVGFVVHTALGTPYYSWKYSHAHHHRHHAHMDKDEHWIPPTRESKAAVGHQVPSTWETLEDTPLYLILRLAIQQVVGFQAYLLMNTSGQPRYPRWTNHFNPKSIIFQHSSAAAVVLSDVGLLVLVSLLAVIRTWLGSESVVRLYVVPWFLMSHWVTMIVFLQHSDPGLPHYRSKQWTYARGAIATMDRDFLGWQGRFFLHNIAHCHLVHHLFPRIPFYNGPQATECVKGILGDDYNYCDTPVFKALWRNSQRCQYVEEEGDVLFYKDKCGGFSRRPAMER